MDADRRKGVQEQPAASYGVLRPLSRRPSTRGLTSRRLRSRAGRSGTGAPAPLGDEGPDRVPDLLRGLEREEVPGSGNLDAGGVGRAGA